jgi:hypothetical protein
MGKKPWLTADGIVAAVKRKITLPDSQELLTDDEILSFVSEEMAVSMVPSILSYHEEFFVTKLLEGGDEEIELEANKSRYPIPSRAIGLRIRDLFFKDQSDNLHEMTRINPDDRVFFNSNSQESSDVITKFYLEGNDLVLVPSVGSNPTGSLVFTYFLRPNQLVEDAKGAVIESFKKTVTVSNSTLTSGDTITINDEEFVAGTDFTIGATPILTTASLVSAINTSGIAEASNVDALMTLLFDDPNIELETSNSTAFTLQTTLTIVCEDNLPDEITAGVDVDLIQTDGGHQCRALSIPVLSINNDQLTVTNSLVPDTLIVGDYVCLENQCIIPQIPSDLHIDLVERACSRILAAIGDVQGMQVTMAKVQENQAKQGILIDNRVDGSPQKVVNRNGLLSWNKRRRF